MKALLIAVVLLAAASAPAQAEEGAWFGFGLTTSVSLFLNVTSAVVNHLHPNSAAAAAGVENGHHLVAIGDCAIPGCGARKAQKLLNVPVGTSVRFTFEKTDGTRFQVPLTAINRGAVAQDPAPADHP